MRGRLLVQTVCIGRQFVNLPFDSLLRAKNGRYASTTALVVVSEGSVGSHCGYKLSGSFECSVGLRNGGLRGH